MLTVVLLFSVKKDEKRGNTNMSECPLPNQIISWAVIIGQASKGQQQEVGRAKIGYFPSLAKNM